MLGLLPVPKIIAVISGIYALLVFLISQFSPMSFAAVWRLSGLLEIVIFLFLMWGWQKVWKWVPKLNEWVFPDLNGTWDAKIEWVWGVQHGSAEGKVLIKQDFLRLSIELETSKSKSQTLAVATKRDPESKRPMVYYIYRCSTNQSRPQAEPMFDGAAVLFIGQENHSLLEGNYWTSRSTQGHFSFRRLEKGRDVKAQKVLADSLEKE